MNEIKLSYDDLHDCLEQGLTVKQIAARYDIATGTVHKKIRRLKKDKFIVSSDEYSGVARVRNFNLEVGDNLMIGNRVHNIISITDDIFTTIRAAGVRESFLIKDFVFHLFPILTTRKSAATQCQTCGQNISGVCVLYDTPVYTIYKSDFTCDVAMLKEDDIYGEDTFISYKQGGNTNA